MNPAEFANIAKSEKDFWWYRGMRSILFHVLEPYLAGRTIRRALETGCGTGYFARLLQTERGWPIVPLDFSWHGLRYAREMGVERAVQGDIRGLPFPDNAFDLVMSVDVLPHLPRGDEYLAARELARVLARGGLLVIRAAALDILRSRHSEFAFERQRFTRRRLMGLMTGAGVRVLRCTYVNSLMLPVALAKFRVWEPLLGKPPASGVEPVAPWLDRLLYAPLALEAAWLGAGHGFPAGQSLVLIGEKMV
ncbi:MAG: class I SAM-dependent methyltransferase [Bryobacteraceae bacterium]